MDEVTNTVLFIAACPWTDQRCSCFYWNIFAWCMVRVILADLTCGHRLLFRSNEIWYVRWYFKKIRQ